MKGDLYRRWLVEGRDLTLEEFVAERRTELRQQRAQRHFGPLHLRGQLQFQQAAMLLQNNPYALYRGHPLHGPGAILSSLLGGLFR